MDDLEPATFDDGKAILFCSSTWGDGELPDNSLDFHAKVLENKGANMKGKPYGNCVLGDHEYDPYYCETGKIWDKVLQPAGAQKVCEDFQINQGPTDDDILGAMQWTVSFVEKLNV